MQCYTGSALRAGPLAAVLLLLLVHGCTCGSGVNEGDVNLISLDEEWQMGDQLAARLEQQLTLTQDPAVQQYVAQMGQRLTDQTELAGRPWTFHVVRDPSLNAFATPGGHVYVHTGLLRAAGSAAELASVMAHEVAHGAARHSTEQMTKVYGLDAVAGLFLERDSGLLQRVLAEFARGGALAKFSRDAEREADRLGQEYLAAAGYDPAAMAAMFETLREARAERPNLVEQFFSSHPLTEERIAAARERAQGMQAAEGAGIDGASFQDAQQRLGR